MEVSWVKQTQLADLRPHDLALGTFDYSKHNAIEPYIKLLLPFPKLLTYYASILLFRFCRSSLIGTNQDLGLP